MRVESAARGVVGALILGALLAPPHPARAALGHASSSVESDRAALGATVSSVSAGAYTVHTLALPNQGVVKEFARGDGTVFAVVWQGPARPDLRQLLGEHFDTLQADNPGRAGGRGRRPLTVNRPELLVSTGGHPGAYWGAAILPPLQPAGFSASGLK